MWRRYRGKRGTDEQGTDEVILTAEYRTRNNECRSGLGLTILLLCSLSSKTKE
jgi:hypothetical protein